MNCKPGDLAVIVLAGSAARNTLGKVVRVIDSGTPLEQAPGYLFDTRACWTYQPTLKFDDGRTEIPRVNDCCLRPIRDPGDDAVDEVLQRLGTPHKETA